MAQKVQIELIDDTDGSVAAETVSFGLDGERYEIDLSDDNVRKLRESVAEYVDHARRATNRAAPRQRPDRVDTAVVRLWLTDHGYELKNRGRIPVELQAAYANSTPHPDWRDEMTLPAVQPPEMPDKTAITEVIANAKDTVRRQRRNKDKMPAEPVAEPTAAGAAATEAKASATAKAETPIM